MRLSLRSALGLLLGTGALFAACSSSDGGTSGDDDQPGDDDVTVPEGDSGPVQNASSSSSSGAGSSSSSSSSSAGGGSSSSSSSSSGAGSSSSSSSSSSSGESLDASVDADAPDAADAEAPDAADAAVDAGVDAGPEPEPDPMTLLRLEGRWDRTLPSTPRTAYPGARIVFRFTGTGATLQLRERKSFKSSAGTSQWSVFVDGVESPKLATTVAIDLEEETDDYVVAHDLAPDLHTVELVRRTEAEFGSTRIVGIQIDAGKVVAPPARSARRLEFVGDSNLTGYGIEGTRPMVAGDPACNHTPGNENWTRAFPALVAARFGAEVEMAAYSGKGVFYNSSRSDADVLGVLYPRSIPTDPTTPYDASQFAAHAVVVLVGGNDFTLRNAGDYPSVADVQGAYDALIGQIRTAHPAAQIACTISPSINDDYPSYPAGHPQAGQSVMVRTKVKTAITNVVAARALAGDPAIFFHDFAAVGNDQLTACDYHPSPALHATLASGLGDDLAAKLAW